MRVLTSALFPTSWLKTTFCFSSGARSAPYIGGSHNIIQQILNIISVILIIGFHFRLQHEMPCKQSLEGQIRFLLYRSIHKYFLHTHSKNHIQNRFKFVCPSVLVPFLSSTNRLQFLTTFWWNLILRLMKTVRIGPIFRPLPM